MRIALETTALAYARRSGIARYAEQLSQALVALRAEESLEITRFCKLSRWKRRSHVPALPGANTRFWKGRIWPLDRPYDLVHATSDVLPDWPRVTRVTTFHDVYPAIGMVDASPDKIAADMARRQRVTQQADLAICTSEVTRRDVVEHLGVPHARTHVVHLGVDARFRPLDDARKAQVRQRFSSGEPYLMFLSFYRPNKNMERLIEAYAASRARRTHRLLLVGLIDEPHRSRLATRLAELRIADRVQLTGFVTERDLPALYAAADAFLLPSLYEGFGLPILEAMACGTPVLTSTAGSCPEVAAGHALLTDPLRVDAIAQGLDAVLDCPRQRTIAAMEYARSKTWEQTARKTLDVYRLALAERGASGAAR